jgi:hypothetical protein
MSNWKPTNNPKDALGTAKAPLHLFPDSAVVAGAMAFLEGREKYGQYNWRATGVRASVYVAALRRHIAAWWNGEDVDPDSGLHHLWKAISCLAVLIDADELGALEDDRPPVVPVADMIARTEAMGEEIRERLKEYDPYQYTERNKHSGPQEDPGPRLSKPEEKPVGVTCSNCGAAPSSFALFPDRYICGVCGAVWHPDKFMVFDPGEDSNPLDRVLR